MTLRKSIIALTLLEAAQALREQQAPPPAPEPVAAPPAPPAPVAAAPEAGVSPAPTGVAIDAETGEALTLDDILERLNIIRSGKSFSDPAVYANLSNWYQKLPPDEQTKLNESLKTIGAIVQSQQPEIAQTNPLAATPEQPAPAAPPAPVPAPEVAAAPPPQPAPPAPPPQ